MLLPSVLDLQNLTGYGRLELVDEQPETNSKMLYMCDIYALGKRINNGKVIDSTQEGASYGLPVSILSTEVRIWIPGECQYA